MTRATFQVPGFEGWQRAAEDWDYVVNFGLFLDNQFLQHQTRKLELVSGETLENPRHGHRSCTPRRPRPLNRPRSTPHLDFATLAITSPAEDGAIQLAIAPSDDDQASWSQLPGPLLPQPTETVQSDHIGNAFVTFSRRGRPAPFVQLPSEIVHQIWGEWVRVTYRFDTAFYYFATWRLIAAIQASQYEAEYRGLGRMLYRLAERQRKSGNQEARTILHVLQGSFRILVVDICGIQYLGAIFWWQSDVTKWSLPISVQFYAFDNGHTYRLTMTSRFFRTLPPAFALNGSMAFQEVEEIPACHY
ncbi:uncharacterized protein Z518_06027 [Rhinocladiella mackenziei CBS 650.93]|uniref:Uncharacterized protein n=1 Tax=Rhinocladiella mackenziei CBS 650.93 TaxID=1442369 RepID=A0A0D2J7Y1_9EURO|nr:uncharacterized protein Z518_06027 [Rhinocladiella mackenziei CBS 650.93]KIX05155.1 hypothetical protein Z518_06027 [Rhinocladiella mackenziei CBS 650.93]